MVINVHLYCVIYYEYFILDLFLKLYVSKVLLNWRFCTLLLWDVVLELLVKLLFMLEFVVLELIKLL